MKIALPQDWNMLSRQEQKTISKVVEDMFHLFLLGASRSGRPASTDPLNPGNSLPEQISLQQAKQAVEGVVRHPGMRISVDDEAIVAIAEYIARNWFELTRPTGTSPNTALDDTDTFDVQS